MFEKTIKGGEEYIPYHSPLNLTVALKSKSYYSHEMYWQNILKTKSSVWKRVNEVTLTLHTGGGDPKGALKSALRTTTQKDTTRLKMQLNFGNCVFTQYPIMVINGGPDNNQFENSGSMEEWKFSTYKSFFKKRLQFDNGVHYLYLHCHKNPNLKIPWNGGGSSFYNTAFQMLVLVKASRAGHFTLSCHLLLVIWFSWTIIAHKDKQATEEFCCPGIFWYAKLLRQTVVSNFHDSSTVI